MKQNKNTSHQLLWNNFALSLWLFLLLQIGLLPKLSAQQANTRKIEDVIKSMPDIKTVYDKFYQTYSYTSNDHLPNVLKFARKKDGWWVYEMDAVHAGPVFHQQLFWSYSTKSYQHLDFDAFKEGDNSTAETDFTYYFSGQLYNYSIIPYYGYNGWANDIINELQYQKTLGDTILEALARAYGELGDIRGGRDYVQKIDATLKNLDDSIDYYLSTVDKELSTYKRLMQQNPGYKTLVGNVFIKYSHEYVNTWMELLMYGKPDMAKKYLPTGLYGATYLDFAKDYLKSCTENAILFTNGDGSTYPLWYVQEVLGYRKDVTVINASLLGINSYIKAIQDKVGISAPVNITIPYQAYASKRLDFISYDKNIISPSFGLLEAVKNISNHIVKLDAQGSILSNAEVLSAKSLYLALSDKGSPMYTNLSGTDKANINDTIYLNPGNYFFRSDFIIFDILAGQYNRRPIYFAYASGFENYMGLCPYLRLEGLAYRLVTSSINTHNDNVPIHKEILFNNLTTKFGFSHEGQHPGNSLSDFVFEAQNLRALFIEDINEYVSANDKNKVEILLQKMEEMLPHDKLPYKRWNYIFLTKAYIYLNQKDRVHTLVKELSIQAEENIAKVNIKTNDGMEEAKGWISMMDYCTGECNEPAFQAEYETLNKKIASLRKKYNISNIDK